MLPKETNFLTEKLCFLISDVQIIRYYDAEKCFYVVFYDGHLQNNVFFTILWKKNFFKNHEKSDASLNKTYRENSLSCSESAFSISITDVIFEILKFKVDSLYRAS